MNAIGHMESSRVILLELEVLVIVLVIGGWGGFVSYLMKRKDNAIHRNIMECLTQIVISCFTGFILSAIAIDRQMTMNMTIIVAGLGGVFATPILRILGVKVKNFLSNNTKLP
jgi:hypothetical protein|nr:phage holin family protein [uncultured Enterobacter sp.]